MINHHKPFSVIQVLDVYSKIYFRLYFLKANIEVLNKEEQSIELIPLIVTVNILAIQKNVGDEEIYRDFNSNIMNFSPQLSHI